ncbi:Protein RGF1 INDUCIBLE TRANSCRIPTION FACTOR 1 [Linum grandiflorum]
MFCLDCCDTTGAFCPYCRADSHEEHTVIQIRKSSYHNVVRMAAMENLLELSGVQPYVINSAQVVFLNERPTKNGSSSSAVQHLCEVCDRSLLDNYRFCSLDCKLARIKRNGDATFKTVTEDENNKDEDDEDESYQSLLASSTPTSPSSAAQRSAGESFRKKPRKRIPMRAPLF